MKNNVTVLLVALFSFSCNSALHSLFEKKTPHEQYAEKLDDTGLGNTPAGRQWLAASQKALGAPQTISLPYTHQGFFHLDKSRALGLQFEARFGERLIFTLIPKKDSAFRLYADLFKQNGGSPALLISADTASSQFSFDVEESGTYILRLQPELFHTGEYSLSVAVGASLGFPVSGNKASIGSFWGDDRDGGKRRHEGIDIFAPKLTPVVAAADGIVTGLRNGGIGGKTVWMKPSGKNIFLYYAHLHQQLVREGQTVKKGAVLGLVGNTGNARYTPSHLHFGVYTLKGAVDPLPFVNRSVKTAPSLSRKDLAGSIKLTRSQKTAEGTLIKANTILVPLAVSAKGYIAELPDGTMLQVPFNAVKMLKQAVRSSDALATLPTATKKQS